MMKFVTKYWKPLLVTAGGVLLWVVARAAQDRFFPNPLQIWERERDASEAALEARALERKRGTDTARELVRRKYQDQIKKADAVTLSKLEDLKYDPVATAKYLARVAADARNNRMR